MIDRIDRPVEVLIFDDEQAHVRSLQFLMESSSDDLVVHGCTRLDEARRIVAERHVRVVIIDFNLKLDGITGFKGIDELLKINHDLRFVMLTGQNYTVIDLLTGNVDEDQCRRYGLPSQEVKNVLDVNDVLVKPVGFEKLYERIESVLA